MKFVALVRSPARPDEAARAVAEGAGLTVAEARMRLAPEPPALLARLAPERADQLVAALREAGLASLAVDVQVPVDRDRTLAHTFSSAPGGVTLAPRFGAPLAIAWPDVLAILRGLRASHLEIERTEKTKRFSAGAAVLTGGLVMTRSGQRSVRSSEEAVEQVILLYARDGRAATLAERELDFSCLGTRMQPSSTANMVEIARLLRERAPGAFYDERLLRLGRRPLPFVTGGESRSRTPATTTASTSTSGSLDVLAEIMRRALVASLLP